MSGGTSRVMIQEILVPRTDTSEIKNNYDSTRDPVSTDDTTSGYSKGSEWINCSSNTLFTCVDATEDNAVWVTGSGDLVVFNSIDTVGTHVIDNSERNQYNPTNATSDVTIQIPDSLVTGWSGVFYRSEGSSSITVELESGSSKTIIGDVSGPGTLNLAIGSAVLILIMPNDLVQIRGDVS